MVCKQCGSVLPKDADVCYVCGTPVRVERPVKPGVYTLDDTAQPFPPEETIHPEEIMVDNAQKADIFARFFSFFFALIGLILYGVQRKNGENAKAVSIANAVMTGFCAKMALAICLLVLHYVTQR